MKMVVQRGYIDSRQAYGILRKYWDPRVGDHTRNMKNFRDGTGIVFDIKSEHFEGFMDNFERLKETEGHKIDFDITKCTDLPDLEDEPGYGVQNWRDQGRNDNYNKPSRGGYNDRRGGGGGFQRNDRDDWGRNNN